MTFLKFVMMMADLVPLVSAAVSTAETIIGPGKGTEKFKYAVEAVKDAIPTVKNLAGVADEAIKAVEPLIETTVAAANAATKRKRKARK